jgi:hypothetical protein
MVDGSGDERAAENPVSEDLYVHPWLSVFGSRVPSDFGALAVLAVFITVLWFVLRYLVSIPLELNTDYLDPTGYLLAILLIIFVGFLIFFAPIWMVHTGLKAAKRALLIEIEGRYDDVVLDQNGCPQWDADVISELDRIDRVHDSTARIRLWPSDVKSVPELLVTSAIPVVQMILLPIFQKILSHVL